jgi:hypothetical protein
MQKITAILTIILFLAKTSTAQGSEISDNIKLFINQKMVADYNPHLSYTLQNRLYNKITGLINQTGVVEIGYSNFLVIPVWDIQSNTMSDAGITKNYNAKCELTLHIMRQSYNENEDEANAAIFNSFSKSFTGSSSSNDKDAISNAISSISNNDADIISFLNSSKIFIADYFRKNCRAIIAEAGHANTLNQYAKAISLYFSVPQNAPCYQEAKTLSINVYKKFTYEQCNKNLLLIRAYTARAVRTDDSSGHYYHKALEIIKDLDPSTPATEQCFQVIKQEISKIEQRFSEEQKREWELKKKVVTDTLEIEKIRAGAMKKISESFQSHLIISSILNHPAGGN